MISVVENSDPLTEMVSGLGSFFLMLSRTRSLACSWASWRAALRMVWSSASCFGVFFEIAADAGFVEGEEGEVLAVLEPDAGLAGGGVDFGAVAMGGVADGAGESYGEGFSWQVSGLRSARRELQWVSKAALSSCVKAWNWPVRPWRRALTRQRFLPSGVLGPVDFWEFCWLAASCAAEMLEGSVSGVIKGSL